MPSDHNEINNVRPTSRFDTYVAKTETQVHALRTMQAIAGNFLSLRNKFSECSNPFVGGAFFVLSGRPGTGKSHLLEALVTDVGEKAPNVLDHMFLLRRDFSLQTASGVTKGTFGRPIVLIDDLFREHQSVSDLSRFDIQCLSNYIAYAYDNRLVTVATCNFPFMDGILARIEAHDKVGRISSRCAELIAVHSGEVQMDGPDHRRAMAEEALKKRQAGQGSSPMLNVAVNGFPRLEK